MKKIVSLITHLFIPHEKNQYQPKAIQLDFLSFYLVLALTLNFGYRLLSHTSLQILGFATDITINKLYQLTNEVRQKYGLLPLRYNKNLEKAAYQKAQDMFQKNYWAHFGPDGTTPWQFILQNGYQYQYAGENLAKNFLFSDGVIDAWMHSQSHRENILKKEYQDVGFAVVNGILNGEETTLVVQMFGSPEQSSLNTPSQKNQIVPPVQAGEKKETTQSPVLAQTEKELPSGKKISLISFNYHLNFVLFILLSIAFISDLYFANRLGLLHLKRKNIFHFLFLSFVILSLLIVKQGKII